MTIAASRAIFRVVIGTVKYGWSQIRHRNEVMGSHFNRHSENDSFDEDKMERPSAAGCTDKMKNVNSRCYCSVELFIDLACSEDSGMDNQLWIHHSIWL